MRYLGAFRICGVTPKRIEKTGGPDTIRTCDLCLRRAALYPAELRVQSRGLVITVSRGIAQAALAWVQPSRSGGGGQGIEVSVASAWEGSVAPRSRIQLATS